MCDCIEEGHTGPMGEDGDEMTAAASQSQLVRWKSVVLSEVQVSRSGELCLFHVVKKPLMSDPSNVLQLVHFV